MFILFLDQITPDTGSYIHTYIHTYIYIYIYIVIHRLFHCITTLQFGQTHESFKLESKPVLFYVSRISYPRIIVISGEAKQIFWYIYTYTHMNVSESSQINKQVDHYCCREFDSYRVLHTQSKCRFKITFAVSRYIIISKQAKWI